MLVLGIESSCDETAAAVVKDGQFLLSNVIASQIDTHSKYGGVVPEIASRKHAEVIGPVILQSLEDAGVTLDELTGVAVTSGPGLVGSLSVPYRIWRTYDYLSCEGFWPYGGSRPDEGRCRRRGP